MSRQSNLPAGITSMFQGGSKTVQFDTPRYLIGRITRKSCYYCEKTCKTGACSRCKMAWYCSVECQKRDYAAHAPSCQGPNTTVYTNPPEICGNCRKKRPVARYIGTGDHWFALCNQCPDAELELERYTYACSNCAKPGSRMMRFDEFGAEISMSACIACRNSAVRMLREGRIALLNDFPGRDEAHEFAKRAKSLRNRPKPLIRAINMLITEWDRPQKTTDTFRDIYTLMAGIHPHIMFLPANHAVRKSWENYIAVIAAESPSGVENVLQPNSNAAIFAVLIILVKVIAFAAFTYGLYCAL